MIWVLCYNSVAVCAYVDNPRQQSEIRSLLLCSREVQGEVLPIYIHSLRQEQERQENLFAALKNQVTVFDEEDLSLELVQRTFDILDEIKELQKKAAHFGEEIARNLDFHNRQMQRGFAAKQI